MLHSMQLLIEMISGAFRALEVQNQCLTLTAHHDDVLTLTAAQNGALTLSAEHDVVLTLPTVYHDVFCIDLDR